MDTTAVVHCCCVRFTDEDGRTRAETHACCPRHWRQAETEAAR